MGLIRTTPAVTVGSSPIPAYAPNSVSAVSFSIKNGIATIVLGAGNLPANGYNGPQTSLGVTAGGQQGILWGFTTATYFNGKNVTVLKNDPVAGSFSFYFNHADVASTNDAGNTAPVPFEHYRMVRIECDRGNGTDTVFVGDLNVSSSQYLVALTLAGQLAIEVGGQNNSQNIPADRIWMVASGVADKVHVSLAY